MERPYPAAESVQDRYLASPTADDTQDPMASLLREFPGHRVLIADDDDFIRSILMDQLCDTGLHLDEAQDGHAAVAMCSQTPYALILMDMQMPGLSGVEATQLIRQLPGHEHTPILALTGSSSAADRSACLQAGMCDFLAKPICGDDLAALILHWLRLSPA